MYNSIYNYMYNYIYVYVVEKFLDLPIRSACDMTSWKSPHGSPGIRAHDTESAKRPEPRSAAHPHRTDKSLVLETLPSIYPLK